jgi:hypothetical protein
VIIRIFVNVNGLAERGVQTIKMMLKKSDPYIALLSYRATPLANENSPAELLMGRKLQTLLPIGFSPRFCLIAAPIPNDDASAETMLSLFVRIIMT